MRKCRERVKRGEDAGYDEGEGRLWFVCAPDDDEDHGDEGDEELGASCFEEGLGDEGGVACGLPGPGGV